MDIVIVRALEPTLTRSIRLVKQLLPEVNIRGTANDTRGAVELFKQCGRLNLAFMDIELADGPSVEVFKQVNVTCPVIFTIPYDEYALNAFIAFALKRQIEMTNVSKPTLIVEP